MSSPTPPQVSIFGTDVAGKPFSETVRLIAIAGFEITLEGLGCTLKVNDTVGLRHAGQKARFRVMWVGKQGTPQQGQVGLRTLEPDKDLLETFTKTALQRSAAAPGGSFAGRERRRYSRIPCHGTVKFRYEGTEIPGAGNLQVLSEGGCFIETASTAPCFSHLDLIVNAEGLELQAAGVVRDSQAGCGMGIAFREINPAHLNRLQEWVFQHCRQ